MIFQPGANVRLHPLSLPAFMREALTMPDLIFGIPIRFRKPGYVAFRLGLHGGPEWWSETHFIEA